MHPWGGGGVPGSDPVPSRRATAVVGRASTFAGREPGEPPINLIASGTPLCGAAFVPGLTGQLARHEVRYEKHPGAVHEFAGGVGQRPLGEAALVCCAVTRTSKAPSTWGAHRGGSRLGRDAEGVWQGCIGRGGGVPPVW